MSNYNNAAVNSIGSKQNNNEMGSFEKSVMSNAKESIQKHLSHMKIQQNQLNYALFLAIQNFKVDQYADECIVILLRHKANPNCEFNLQTPLTVACKKGQQIIVKTLLQYGAKPDLCNKNGQHPLAVLLKDRRQNYDVAQTLISYMPSVNMQINGQHPLVLAVQRQFYKVFQLLIQKGANLVFQSQNILHAIVKKKFNKVQKKKKFIKQLAGKLFLMNEDCHHKLPTEYEQNQEIKAFILDNFKPKVLKQDSYKQESASKTFKQKELKEIKNKDFDSNGKDNKKKAQSKDLDISFSQIDEEQFQQDKGQLGYQPKKLQQVVEIPEEEQPKQKNNKLSIQKQFGSNSPIINRKIVQMGSPKEIQIHHGHAKQPRRQKPLQESFHFVQFKQEQKQKIKKKLNSLAGSTKKQSEVNAGKKKKAKNVQQIIPKTLLKRKNSSFEDQNTNIKHDKNKITVKKGNQSQKPEKIEKDKGIIEEQKTIQIKRIQIFKEFEELGLHLQDEKFDISEKSQKQSETDSEESFQGSFVTLTEQIYEIVNTITIKNQQKVLIIQSIIKYIEYALRKQLQKQRQNLRLQIYIYGSQSTGLSIQDSDVDLLVSTDFDSIYLMRILEQRGTLDIDGILQVKFISGATMPVIKIQTNQKFDGISVDLTFQTRNHMGIKCSETVKAFMVAEPLLRPLVLVIKVLVNKYSLSDPYKGGLGSYAITLMVIALLQFTETDKKKQENVGELLLNFFYFYGQQIDYISQAIIIHALGLFGQQPVYCIYRLPYFTDLNPKLIIYDPLNPVNNVGRTTYRIASLKKMFSICYLRLKQDPRCQLKDIMDGSFTQLLCQY